MSMLAQEVDAMDECKCGQSVNPRMFRSKTECANDGRWIEHEQGNSAVDCNGGFGNKKDFQKIVSQTIFQKNHQFKKNLIFKLHLIFWRMQRCLMGLWNMVFPIWSRSKTTEHEVENKAFTSPACLILTQSKTMLVGFFDQKGTVHYEFIEQGTTDNQHCYLESLKRLGESVWKRRPVLWPNKWTMLLHMMH